MADEAPETAVAEPKEEISLKDFGSLDEAFDRAFPATAEKPEGEETPEPTKAAEPVKAAPEPPKAAPEPAKAPESDLPDFLTGKIEQKKPEPTPEPEIKIESAGVKELRTHYKTLKHNFDTARKEAETLRQQLEEAKKVPAQAPADAEATIRELQQKNQELSDALEQGYVENHPAIRAKYVDGRNKEVEKAHRILNAVKSDPKMWDQAMTMPLESRLEALEEIHLMMPQAAKDLLSRSESAIDELDLERDQVLSDKKGLRERLQQQDLVQRRQQLEEHQKQTVQRLDYAVKDLSDRLGLEVLKKSDNPAHAKWNEGVDRRIADARKLMLEVDDEDTMARASILAASALDYRHLYQLMRDRALEAEKRIKSFESAEPSLETKEGESPKVDDKLTFAEAVAAQFPRR